MHKSFSILTQELEKVILKVYPIYCYVWVLRPASFLSLQLAEPCRIVHREKGADPSCLCWPGRNESVTQVWFAEKKKGVCCHLPKLQRSEAQSIRNWVFKYTGVWSCAEGTASEESGKESCVIEPAIEGSIGGGSITQHYPSLRDTSTAESMTQGPGPGTLFMI